MLKIDFKIISYQPNKKDAEIFIKKVPEIKYSAETN